MNSYEIIVNSLKWLFVFRAFTGIFSGFFLIFKPTYFKSLNTKLNKWYSLRKRLKPFEIMRETDFYIYRNSQNWGWAMLAGSVFFLTHYFSWQLPEGFMDFMFPNFFTGVFVEILLRSFMIFLALFIIVGLPLCRLLIINLGKVKNISRIFNQWISTRFMVLKMDKMNVTIDEFILKHNQLFGILFIMGSIYLLFQISY